MQGSDPCKFQVKFERKRLRFGSSDALGSRIGSFLSVKPKQMNADKHLMPHPGADQE
jgi:hypothetical protein